MASDSDTAVSTEPGNEDTEWIGVMFVGFLLAIFAGGFVFLSEYLMAFVTLFLIVVLSLGYLAIKRL